MTCRTTQAQNLLKHHSKLAIPLTPLLIRISKILRLETGRLIKAAHCFFGLHLEEKKTTKMSCIRFYFRNSPIVTLFLRYQFFLPGGTRFGENEFEYAFNGSFYKCVPSNRGIFFYEGDNGGFC